MADEYRFGYVPDEDPDKKDADSKVQKYVTSPSADITKDKSDLGADKESEPKKEKSEPKKTDVIGEGIYYRTREVAEELGISEQDVRNYSQHFSEFLDIDKTASGHRRFTRENIDQLASILELKHNNNYTIEQTKAALATDEGEILVAKDGPEKLKKLMEWTITQMQNVVREEVSAAIKQHGEELRIAGEAEQTKLLKQKESDQKTILELKDSVKNLSEQIDKITAESKEKDAKIDDLIAQNEQLQKKKRGFFFRNRQSK